MACKTALGLALILLPLGAARGAASPFQITGMAASGSGPAEIRIEIFPATHKGPVGRRIEPVAGVRPRADGFFSLAVPEPGVYRAVVRADGFLPLEIAALPVVDETVLPPVEMQPARPLEIRLTDPAGRAAAWVAVCAEPWHATDSHGSPRWEPAERCGTTGQDGRLVLSRGRDERPVLSVVDPRFAAQTFEVGEDGIATLRMEAARTVSLEVRGPDGKPAAGVLARLGSPDLGIAGVTDPAGRLAVGVPEHGMDVELRGDAGLRGRAVFYPGPPAEREPRIVTLAPPRMMSGRVLDAVSRRPVAGALVWTGEAETRTMMDGTFRIALGADRSLGAAAAAHAPRLTAVPRGGGVLTLALAPAGAPPGWEGQGDSRRGSSAGREIPSGRVLAGRVLDPNGRPVSEAWVEVSPNHGTETDGDGRFRIVGLAPGATVSLRAGAPGLRGMVSAVRIPADRNPAPVDIRLQPAAALEGRVTDAGGKPVAGATVMVPLELAGGPSRTTTDDDGHYLLESLAPGRHDVVALRATSGKVASVSLDLREGSNHLDLAALPGLGVAGRVLDDRGSAVPGARIFLEGADPEDRWIVVGAEDGSFVLHGIPEGDYRLSVLAEGFAQPTPQQVHVASAVQGLELRLGRGASVVGNLVGISLEDLNGLVILAQDVPAAHSRRMGLAGADGRYRIANLPPGHWRVTGRTATGRQALGSVEVASGSGETALDLRFSSGLTLTGRLSVDGKPAAGAVLATTASREASEADGGGQATAGPDGAFAILGLRPGSYLLLALLDNALWPVQTVELTADREIALALVTGTLSGRVLGPYGSPLAGAQVSLRPRTLGLEAILPGPRAQSDERGAFELLRIPAGSHRLLVTRDGAAPFETAVTVPAGGIVQVEIPLGPSG